MAGDNLNEDVLFDVNNYHSITNMLTVQDLIIFFVAPATFQGVEMWHQNSVIRDIKLDTKTT